MRLHEVAAHYISINIYLSVTGKQNPRCHPVFLSVQFSTSHILKMGLRSERALEFNIDLLSPSHSQKCCRQCHRAEAVCLTSKRAQVYAGVPLTRKQSDLTFTFSLFPVFHISVIILGS